MQLEGLKVVHLTSVHIPFDSRIFQKECRSLAEAGCQVILVAPHDKEEVVDGVRVVPLAKEPSRLGRVLHSARKAVAIAVGEDADVYHLHDPELLIWAGRLKKLGRVVIFDMHEDLPLQIRSKTWITGFVRPAASVLAKTIERGLIGTMPVVLAESSYKKKRKWLGDSVDVLNFPRLDWLSSLRNEEIPKLRPRIGYIGAVTRERGSLVTLEALRILKDKGVLVDFECIGPTLPGHRAELEETVKQLGLTGVNLGGYLPPNEGWRRIAQCDLGIAVLEPIPNYMESYPTKMFEYMGMGLPVVVSDFPLYRDIVDGAQCGFAVDPMNPGSVAEAIEYLVEDRKRAQAMGAKGQAVALRDFNWETEKEKLFDFYLKMLESDD